MYLEEIGSPRSARDSYQRTIASVKAAAETSATEATTIC